MQLESARAPVTHGERQGVRERAGTLVGALWAPAVAAILSACGFVLYYRYYLQFRL